jgi:hypothetical protein
MRKYLSDGNFEEWIGGQKVKSNKNFRIIAPLNI